MIELILPRDEGMKLWEASQQGNKPVAYLGQALLLTGHPTKRTHSTVLLQAVLADPRKRSQPNAGGSNADR